MVALQNEALTKGLSAENGIYAVRRKLWTNYARNIV